MIYTDPATGATTNTDAAGNNYLNRLTPNTFLIILAVVVIVALIIIFMQSSSNGNNSSSPAAVPQMGFPLNTTMRANPFVATPQRL
ncbi:occlusion-derived virus envelope protein E18 [Orgyia pseudotsugata multiple nucleopolyhedrovirus]|uniref:Occlusion-derived virus envelope protein E18 n=1 Tax=Orgyia pseudotsugata multicapsid polyhedrosis virus TaxID=262177 RepID=OE18_NPVOP|nr:occlusion-derived virus envelope protein E18 [Orgyia pseudotsugata multiple nucleopolyhedrovirus]O10371.1 RecName: Full=Occlusion-derived virus envelope protein E18; Short=ODV-E18 [Orgyia pseudotsugata multiple nucleopolyhedrovirus]pir/T10409/ envelope protein E18 - Orgyia pseudotsugata nuclear polyhedrosis virus [Orgyia pseudotsugata single capsid nuclopolyhedrovirus]AAC59139.1 occlusion-derived virus envelope protein E18 [Orgyia pseudotsugata multiple nucleopolyhedrovirus]